MTNPTETPQTPRMPTIQVSGTAVRQQPPTSGRTTVKITQKAPSRDEAWIKFNEALSQLIAAIGGNGKVGNSLPRESTEETTKMLRTETEYTVADDVEITFEPALIGEVIAVLLSFDLEFSTPTFVFEKLPKMTPELLGEAAGVAKRNAAGLVAGIGAHLGRLVSINYGPPQLKTVYRPITEIEPNFGARLNSILVNKSASMSSFLDSWNYDEEQLATYDTEVQVTVEYEVIEDETLVGAA